MCLQSSGDKTPRVLICHGYYQNGNCIMKQLLIPWINYIELHKLKALYSSKHLIYPIYFSETPASIGLGGKYYNTLERLIDCRLKWSLLNKRFNYNIMKFKIILFKKSWKRDEGVKDWQTLPNFSEKSCIIN